jgi:hypothetical protein
MQVFLVIQAKAGIQGYQLLINPLDPGACPGPDPGFAGVTPSPASIKYAFCDRKEN